MSIKVEPNQFFHSDGVWEPDEKQLKYIQKILEPLPFDTTVYILVSGVFGSTYSLKPKDTLILKPEHVKRKDVIIHEFGHHIWHELLDPDQQWAWREFVDTHGKDAFKRNDHKDIYNEYLAHTAEYTWGQSAKRVKDKEKAELLKNHLLKILKRTSEAKINSRLEFQKYLKLITKYAHKRNFKIKELGKVNGLPIIVLTRKRIKDVPTILVSAGFHGDEIAGPLGIIYFLKHASPALLEQVNISFLPLISPSGFIQRTHLNEWGENPNRGYCPHITEFKGETLSHEGRVLARFWPLLHELAKDGLLSLHEDSESDATYLYTYEKTLIPGQFSRIMRNNVEDYFVHYRDGNYSIGDIHNGIIYRECDGAFEDHVGHLGTSRVVTSETPGQRDIKERLIAIEGIVIGFIKYFIGAHMKELTKELKKRGYKNLASKIKACFIKAEGEEQPAPEPKEDPTTKLQEAIIELLKSNPNPSDEDVHNLAEQLKVEPDVLEEAVYKLLADLLKGVGKHVDAPNDKYDPKQLEMGIKVEHEHTDNDAIAKEIAKDHLSEPGLENYYTLLLDMEKKAKEQAGKNNKEIE